MDFLGLDYQTLMYLGYTAAALATLGYAHYLTRNGSTTLGLGKDDLQLIAKGAIKGALHTEGLDDILTCLADPIQTIKEFEDAVKQFEKEDMASITKGFLDLAAAFNSLAKGIKDCDKETTKRELEIFEKMLASFKDPKSLAIAASKNLVLNGVEIYHEMSAAYTNYKVKEWEGFGRDIGVALALVFIGACDKECTDSHNAMKSIIQDELYPTNIGGDDNAMYIAYLDMIMRQREEAEYRAAHPVAESPEDLLASYPEEDVYYDAQEYVNLINLMSMRNKASYLY